MLGSSQGSRQSRPSIVQEREVKVVLLGETGVGKTSLVVRFVTGSFRTNGVSTIGASFMSKMLLVDRQAIKYAIWDTAGQERYRSLASMYYQSAEVGIVVYDVTNRESYQRMVDYWIPELHKHGPEGMLVALVGNKNDLAGDKAVSEEEAREFAQEVGALFIETSAKENTNIEAAFVEISRRLPPKEPTQAELSFTLESRESSSGCC